jgi:hypothetical protein
MANITVNDLVGFDFTQVDSVSFLQDLTEELLNLQGGAGEKSTDSSVGLCDVIIDFPGFDNPPRRI